MGYDLATAINIEIKRLVKQFKQEFKSQKIFVLDK